MAKKAGKSKKKVAVRKPARKHTPSRKAAPKPAAPAGQAAAPETPKAPPEYPWNVLVLKGADKVPVTVTDEAHYARLCEEFGANHVEVQS